MALLQKTIFLVEHSAQEIVGIEGTLHKNISSTIVNELHGIGCGIVRCGCLMNGNMIRIVCKEAVDERCSRTSKHEGEINETFFQGAVNHVFSM